MENSLRFCKHRRLNLIEKIVFRRSSAARGNRAIKNGALEPARRIFLRFFRLQLDDVDSGFAQLVEKVGVGGRIGYYSVDRVYVAEKTQALNAEF